VRWVARACAVLLVIFASASMFVAAEASTPKTSSAVEYVFDFGTGSNDNSGPESGSSIFVNALTGVPPKGSYTTADGTKTVTVTDVPISTLDTSGVGALTGFDTIILYQICDIGSHPKAMSAINTFLANGGKVMLFDADRCAPPPDEGLADYLSFLFRFSTSSPGPQGASGSYTNVVSSSLTAGLSAGPQTGDSVGDANIFTSFFGSWCASITATNILGANGFVEATARTASGGLAIYEGEDFWFTSGPSPHLRLVFDDMLKQNWAPDGLPCTVPASGISLRPPSQTQLVSGKASLTAIVVDINGHRVPGVPVTFTVTRGPNHRTSASRTTGSSGSASFSYGGMVTGTDNVVASFVGNRGVTHFSNPATVIWQAADPRIATTGLKFNAPEGSIFSGPVARFTDPDTSTTASEYAATINWGDGSSSSGRIAGSGANFSVSGTHRYADVGSFGVVVTITDVDNSSNTVTASSDGRSTADASPPPSGSALPSPSATSGSASPPRTTPPQHSRHSSGPWSPVALIGGTGGGLALALVVLLVVTRAVSMVHRRRNRAWVHQHLRVAAGPAGPVSAHLQRRPGAVSASFGLEPHLDRLGNQQYEEVAR